MNKLNCKPGEIWRTREGGKFRVYALDGSFGGFPAIHGADYCAETGCWISAHRHPNGKAFAKGESGLDLISRMGWRDEIPWAHIRKEYRFVRGHSVYGWHACKSKPTSTGLSANDEWVSLAAIPMPHPDCPWQETLTERPE